MKSSIESVQVDLLGKAFTKWEFSPCWLKIFFKVGLPHHYFRGAAEAIAELDNIFETSRI